MFMEKENPCSFFRFSFRAKVLFQILSRFGDVILNLSSKKAVTSKGVSICRNFVEKWGFQLFILNKKSPLAPLLIIFVDILPKVGAVSFAEFFHQ